MRKYDAYIRGWRKRLDDERFNRLIRMSELQEKAAKCTSYLIQKYHVKRVYLFGSLVHDRLFHDRSDIDLAVEGLPSSVYFSAVTALWEIDPPDASVDLIPLEDIDESFKDRIIIEGKLLYEQK